MQAWDHCHTAEQVSQHWALRDGKEGKQGILVISKATWHIVAAFADEGKEQQNTNKKKKQLSPEQLVILSYLRQSVFICILFPRSPVLSFPHFLPFPL